MHALPPLKSTKNKRYNRLRFDGIFGGGNQQFPWWKTLPMAGLIDQMVRPRFLFLFLDNPIHTPLCFSVLDRHQNFCLTAVLRKIHHFKVNSRFSHLNHRCYHLVCKIFYLNLFDGWMWHCHLAEKNINRRVPFFDVYLVENWPTTISHLCIIVVVSHKKLWRKRNFV